MELINFDEYPYSMRNGMYGGRAGDKDGILMQGEYWIIKYPKSTRSMIGPDLPSYTTSPLSEYIGSKIYKLLGYDVHDVLLGFRNNKIVVACHDFCHEAGRLMEMRTIQNAANRQLSEELERLFHNVVTGEYVDLEELLLHLDYNPVINKSKELAESVRQRLFDMMVIDI